MTTIRVAKRDRFTAIARATINDTSLSFRARGVLVWLLDKPDDWKTNADLIASAGIEGRDAIRTAISELETAGYVVRAKWRDPVDNTWRSEWTVRERPFEPQRISSDGYPATDSQASLLNTEPTTELANVSTFSPRLDPSDDCVQCQGTGIAYHPGAGRDGPCLCTKPLAPIEERTGT